MSNANEHQRNTSTGRGFETTHLPAQTRQQHAGHAQMVVFRFRVQVSETDGFLQICDA